MGTLLVIGRPLGSDALIDTMEGLVANGEEVHVIFVRGGLGDASDRDILQRMGFARSLSCLDCDVEGLERVDYHGWLSLIEGCEKVVSWT